MNTEYTYTIRKARDEAWAEAEYLTRKASELHDEAYGLELEAERHNEQGDDLDEQLRALEYPNE